MHLEGQLWYQNSKSQTYNFKAKYANQKPNLELNLVITGQTMLVQVSMGTENFVIFSTLS